MQKWIGAVAGIIALCVTPVSADILEVSGEEMRAAVDSLDIRGDSDSYDPVQERIQKRIALEQRSDRWILDTPSFLDQNRLHEAVIWHRWSSDSLEYKRDADIISRLIQDNYTKVLVDTMYQVYGQAAGTSNTGVVVPRDQFHESVLMATLSNMDGYDSRLKQVYSNPDQPLEVRREAFFSITDAPYVRKAVLDQSEKRQRVQRYAIEVSYLTQQGLRNEDERVISQDDAENIAWNALNQEMRIAAVYALVDRERLETLLKLSDRLCTPTKYRLYRYGDLEYGPDLVHCGNKDVRSTARKRLDRLFVGQ